MLKKVEDGEGFNLVNFKCSEKTETPEENKEFEEDFKSFLAKGISNIVRDGICLLERFMIWEYYILDKNLIMTAGGEQRILTHDDVRTKQDDAKRAPASAAKGGRGDFKR